MNFAVAKGLSISNLEAATERFPSSLSSSRCNEVSGLWTPCLCNLEMCIGWYPCGLKYCKGKTGVGDSSSSVAGQTTTYRCGIKTCRKCSQFTYYVRQKQQCLWDEWRGLNGGTAMTAAMQMLTKNVCSPLPNMDPILCPVYKYAMTIIIRKKKTARPNSSFVVTEMSSLSLSLSLSLILMLTFANRCKLGKCYRYVNMWPSIWLGCCQCCQCCIHII